MNKKKTFLLIYFLLGFGAVFSQEDVSEYFDDGGISTSKNQLKTNLFAMINGNWTINYQRKFTERFYIEAGIGKTTPTFSFHSLDPQYLGYINTLKGGYSFSINPKIEYAGDDRFCFTFGVKYRVRNYEKKQLEIKDYMFYTSAEYIIGKHVVIELASGYGLSFITETFNAREFTAANPIDFKIGYTF